MTRVAACALPLEALTAAEARALALAIVSTFDGRVSLYWDAFNALWAALVELDTGCCWGPVEGLEVVS